MIVYARCKYMTKPYFVCFVTMSFTLLKERSKLQQILQNKAWFLES